MKLDGVSLLEGSTMVNAVLPAGNTFPTSPDLAELFFKTGTSAGVYVYNGSGWVPISSGESGGGGTVDKAALGLDRVDNTNDLEKPISTATQAALDLKVNYTDIGIVTIKNINGDYVLTTPDMTNTLVRINSPMGTTAIVTVPTDAMATAAIGSTVTISSSGAGPVQLVAASGATIRSPQSLIIDRKYGRVVIVKVNNNEWEVDGQLQAQAQILINTINLTPNWYNLFYTNSDPMTDLGPGVVPSMLRKMYINGNGIDAYVGVDYWDVVNDQQLPTGSVDGSWNPGGTNQFSNVVISGKYVRAVSISGGGLYQPPANYQTNAYAGWSWGNDGEWRVWTDYQTGWMLEPCAPGIPQTPSVIRIDVADGPSDADILGHFFFVWTSDSVRYGWFKPTNFHIGQNNIFGGDSVIVTSTDVSANYSVQWITPNEPSVKYLNGDEGPTFWQYGAGFRYSIINSGTTINPQDYSTVFSNAQPNLNYAMTSTPITLGDRSYGPVTIEIILESNGFGAMTTWTSGVIELGVNNQSWLNQWINTFINGNSMGTSNPSVTIFPNGDIKDTVNNYLGSIFLNSGDTGSPRLYRRSKIKVMYVSGDETYNGNIPLDTIVNWAEGTADTISISSGAATYAVEVYIDAYINDTVEPEYLIASFQVALVAP